MSEIIGYSDIYRSLMRIFQKGCDENKLNTPQYNWLYDALQKQMPDWYTSRFGKWMFSNIGLNAVHEWTEKELKDAFVESMKLEDLEKMDVLSNEIVLNFSNEPYPVRLDDIETERDLLNKCYVLLGKGWMNNFRVKLFISLVSDVKGFELDEEIF